MTAAATAALFGLIVGSFLNVCIIRLPLNKSVIINSSHCPICGKVLGARDLVPVFSYLFLKGKCRYCKSPISARYPLIELLTGIVFFITALEIGFTAVLAKYLLVFSLLIVVFCIDIDHQIIPNQLVWILLAWGIGWQLSRPEISWMQSLFGALLGGGLLLFLAVVSQGGMGGGDIKLMFASGFLMGPLLTGLALFLGFLSGGALSLILLLLGIKNRKDSIPFGPFLVGGIFVSILWGSDIINAYLRFVGL